MRGCQCEKRSSIYLEYWQNTNSSAGALSAKDSTIVCSKHNITCCGEGCISRSNTTIDGKSAAFWRRKLKRECLQDVKCWASTHSTDVKRKLHEAQPFCSPWYTLLHFLSYIFLHSYSSTLFSQSTNSPGENNDAEGIDDLDVNDGDDWDQVHTENDDNDYDDRQCPDAGEGDIIGKNAFSDISFYWTQRCAIWISRIWFLWNNDHPTASQGGKDDNSARWGWGSLFASWQRKFVTRITSYNWRSKFSSPHYYGPHLNLTTLLQPLNKSLIYVQRLKPLQPSRLTL